MVNAVVVVVKKKGKLQGESPTPLPGQARHAPLSSKTLVVPTITSRMQISKILVAFFLAALFVVAAHGKQLREERRHLAYASGVGRGLAKYVVPAGEQKGAKFFLIRKRKRKHGCANCEKGNAPVKYITVDGGFAK